MSRLVRWLKRQADHNAVSYSRFGLPGEETDDRPPPSEIHVAPFDETAKEFMLCGVHSQRMALMSSGVGMAMTLFVFVSIFFEFDWYHHEKGVDVATLGFLVIFFLMGMLIHYQVIVGVRNGSAKLLIPFLIVYLMLVSSEALMCMFMIIHLLTGATTMQIDGVQATTNVFIFALIFYGVLIAFQGMMLESVSRCRQYLSKKQIHVLELQIAGNSKSRNPGLESGFGKLGADHQCRSGQWSHRLTACM
ncbi:unnamed protein product, partial [Mesorhabditis belari]|uniref:Uncharacterized protein n=1 Tax=Mesorhabditis belari TaxID=2138241 RepID=A0AAF3FDL0_9BILA